MNGGISPADFEEKAAIAAKIGWLLFMGNTRLLRNFDEN